MSAWAWTGIPIGLAFGFVLSRGRFCMNSAFRDILVLKDYALIKAVGIAIAVSMFGFAIMSAAGAITVNPKPLVWGANILGGFIFGIGMVVAGGCASGITYRFGEGMVGAMSAVVGFSLLALTTSAGVLKGVPKFFSENTTVKLADDKVATLFFGADYWVVALPISIVAIVAVLGWFAIKRTRGKTTGTGSATYSADSKSVSLSKRIFKLGWGWALTGVAIGAVAIVAFPASAASGRNYPLGITGGYSNFVKTLVTGENFISWEVLLVLSAIVGAMIAALVSGEFKLRAPAPKVLIQTFFGGALMGFGATVAGGCNIGHILSGVPQLSFGSMLSGAFIILGAWFMAYWLFIRPMKKAGL